MDIARYWNTIFDTLQDGILIVDSRGKIIAANAAAERTTGYTAGELVGSSCRILNCTGCRIVGRGAGEKWCSLFSAGKIRAKQCTITNKEGRRVHIIKNASVLRDENGVGIGAVETLTDITQSVRQEQEIAALRKTFLLDEGHHGIIGESPAIQNVLELIDNVAQSEAPVMIHGPSGTGKELVARAIHETGPRKGYPLIKVNCAALNENLLESELFGHVRGAYTGAERTRIGRFEAAHEGSIFLDEIGDAPPTIQVKLLRVLEEQVIERVGDHKPIPVNVRVITATNKNLEAIIRQGLFREDLFFRINVFPIRCPALAERKEDLPLLVRHFIHRNTTCREKDIRGLSPEVLQIFETYSWPGNVRELRNAVEYAAVLCPGGLIGPEHLPPRILDAVEEKTGAGSRVPDASREKSDLLAALRTAGGNRSAAARLLGVSRVTVWKRMKKYGITG